MLLLQEGTELAGRKPQYGAVVAQRLQELRRRWAELRSAAEDKGRQLFEAERAALYTRSYGELESWLGRAQEELRHAEKVKDLTATNLLLKRLTVGTGTPQSPLGRGGRSRGGDGVCSQMGLGFSILAQFPNSHGFAPTETGRASENMDEGA